MWEAHYLARLFVCGFFAVCFLQSGFDKLFDWKGNLEYFSTHFATSPLKPAVPLLLGVITLLEIATGLACASATLFLYRGVETMMPLYALSLACLTLLSLFAGQRIAKDYAGASTIAIYFGVALLGLWIVQGPA